MPISDTFIYLCYIVYGKIWQAMNNRDGLLSFYLYNSSLSIGTFITICAANKNSGGLEISMEIVYKEISRKEKDQVINLINTVLQTLERPEFFVPYEQWELDRLFDKSYAFLHGAYADGKLVGMAQLYVEETILYNSRKLLSLEDYKIAELGGNLVLPEYRGCGITTFLIKTQIELARDTGYEYLIAHAHPANTSMNFILLNLGMNKKDTIMVNNQYLRNVYLIKIKQ